ncbi:MAG: ATP-dependent sacrificial sulfur transferase LarE [Planctomycetota bacterium]|jgi:uncharacterized protein
MAARKSTVSETLKRKERKLRRILERFGRVLVAYSGGTDSTLLLFEAARSLGPENVLAVTAVSEVYTPEEKDRAASLCKKLKVKHRLLSTDPLKSDAFCRNDAERCYHCKKRLLDRLSALARRMKFPAILEASQIDDEGDYRPGAKAVQEYGVASPLQEAGMNKDDVRRLSRHHKLPTADLPAAACLASRVPYGTAITRPLLKRLGAAESAIRGLGFRQFRLRHHGDVARLEFEPSEMERAFRFRRALSKRVEDQGWIYVTLDLAGYSQGSLNRPLGKKKQ